MDVFNPAFDVTPHQNLTGIITEKGIIYPPFKENIERLRRGESM
jgi:methylthioribose-1-phosphate isomerase